MVKIFLMMSVFVLALLRLAPADAEVLTSEPQSENAPIYFVFDIDGTLVKPIPPNLPINQLPDLTQMIPLRGDIFGQRYQVLNGAGELIQSLLIDIPRSRIMFFSAGRHEKNIQILKALKLPDGRSALEISDRVMSYQFLSEVKAENGNPLFASKKALRKDLRKARLQGRDPGRDLGRDPGRDPGRNLGGDHSRDLGGDLERVLLIDNSPKWSLPGQEGNLLWVEPEKNQVSGQKANPNKLVWVRGVIDSVLEGARVRGVSPKQVLTELQWTGDDPSNWVFKDSLRTDENLYQRGLSLLQRHNPKLQLVGQPSLPKAADQSSLESTLQRRESAKARIRHLETSCIDSILQKALDSLD